VLLVQSDEDAPHDALALVARVASKALTLSIPPEDIETALNRSRTSAGETAESIRWLCMRRLCPLTTPACPF